MQTMTVRVVLCAALCASASPALAEQEWGGVASGKGRIAIAPFEQTYDEFEAKFATAVRNATSDHVWLLISDAEAPGYGWATAGDPVEVLRQWCEYEHARWVLYDLDAKGEPQLAHECATGGALSTAMISNINGLASVAPTWEIFDGKTVRGRIRSGSGYCNDDYCEQLGDFTVEVAIP